MGAKYPCRPPVERVFALQRDFAWEGAQAECERSVRQMACKWLRMRKPRDAIELPVTFESIEDRRQKRPRGRVVEP